MLVGVAGLWPKSLKRSAVLAAGPLKLNVQLIQWVSYQLISPPEYKSVQRVNVQLIKLLSSIDTT